MSVRLRFVEVDLTEPKFAGDDRPWTQVLAEIDLEEGERIVSVESLERGEGTLNHDRIVVARVWIQG